MSAPATNSKSAHALARRRYWAANADETGSPDTFGTVAWCIERVAEGETVGPEAGAPTWAPFLCSMVAEDVGVSVVVDWEDETRALTLRPGPGGVSAPLVDGPRPRELEAVEIAR